MRKIMTLLLIVVIVLNLTACQDKKTENDTMMQNVTAADTGTGSKAESAGKILGSNEESEALFADSICSLYMGDHTIQKWEDMTQVLSITWQSLDIDPKMREKYSLLHSALESLNRENLQYAEMFMEELEVTALDQYHSLEEFEGWHSASEYYVQRADSRIVSVRESFADGFQPSYSLGWNWDPITGELLELEDVFKDTDALLKILAEKICEKYPEAEAESVSEYLQSMDLAQFNWSLGYQGITFHFMPGEFVLGMEYVTIWFEEIGELIEEQYLEPLENGYAVELEKERDTELDLDKEDGHKDVIRVSWEADETGFTDGMNISVNGQNFKDADCYGYDYTVYLTATGSPDEERYFLYVEALAENDYTSLYVYDLNEGIPQCTGVIYGTGFAGQFFEETAKTGYFDEVFTDPSDFVLHTRMDVLGTMTAAKRYTVDYDSGMPVTQMDYYEITADSHVLESKIPLKLLILSEEKTEEIPAGTTFSLVRTDGETYADLLMEDGRECRVEIGFDGWSRTVNGIDEEECFDGLMYAG